MNRWRDLYTGEVRPEQVGERITVAGWVAHRRDHGGLIFIDLRDRAGLVQTVVNPSTQPEAFNTASTLHDEYVVEIQGTAEQHPFDDAQLKRMMDLARRGIESLIAKQQAVLSKLMLRQ